MLVVIFVFSPSHWGTTVGHLGNLQVILSGYRQVKFALFLVENMSPVNLIASLREQIPEPCSISFIYLQLWTK